MWKRTYSEVAVVSRANLWRLYTDVKGWHLWDMSLSESSLHGDFAVGSSGDRKDVGGLRSSFEIRECTPERSFSYRTRLLFTWLTYTHTITDEANGLVKISHGVELSGLLTFLFSALLGQHLTESIPGSLSRLIERARGMK